MDYLEEQRSYDSINEVSACPKCFRQFPYTNESRRYCEFCGASLSGDRRRSEEDLDSSHDQSASKDQEAPPPGLLRNISGVPAGKLLSEPDLEPFFFPANYQVDPLDIARRTTPAPYHDHGGRNYDHLVSFDGTFLNGLGEKAFSDCLQEITLLNPGYLDYDHVKNYLQKKKSPADDTSIIKEIKRRRQALEVIFREWIYYQNLGKSEKRKHVEHSVGYWITQGIVYVLWAIIAVVCTFLFGAIAYVLLDIH